jgi:flavodoxin
MKILIAYSSKTGNTRQVAEAIHSAVPEAELFPVKEAPDPAGYDLVFAGFWVDKGTADARAQAFMDKLKQQQVALFATLGAYPDSDHAADSLNAAALLIPSCTVVDRFICQGAIDPKLIEWMKQLPPEHGHAPDEARRKRWKDAESHPDATDLENAAHWAKGVVDARSLVGQS